MKKIPLISLFLILSFSAAYSQKDSVPPINDHKDRTDSLVGYSNLTPVIKDSSTVPTFNKIKRNVYHLKPAVDIPIVAIGTGWSLYAFTKIYNKEPSTEAEVLALKTSDINSIDRGAVRPYKKSLDDVSYYPFYAAMPLPFVFFLTGGDMREDFWKLSFLYWETMSVTGLFGTGATYFVDRYRPYTYDAETPMDKRTNQNSKNSFYAGHVEIVSSSTFFIAKVYSDYYPDSKIKWVFYGGAAAATGMMAYMRYEAGMHFPTDIALGTTMGALTGILVPQFHKQQLIKGHDMSFTPFYNGEQKGFTFIYK